jgi:hypothetical protein
MLMVSHSRLPFCLDVKTLTLELEYMPDLTILTLLSLL